eukprot:GHUV01032120.1.p1 GENE.GHUV01032120.1~~GHUV01032120.1.p1  ORF type:complete len:212 (-),score=39.29 GHUV01032120.1:159-794(-)
MLLACFYYVWIRHGCKSCISSAFDWCMRLLASCVHQVTLGCCHSRARFTIGFHEQLLHPTNLWAATTPCLRGCCHPMTSGLLDWWATSCVQAGEFWWKIQMDATPGGPEQLPLLTAPLGRSASCPILVSNPTAAEAHFNCHSSDPMRFVVNPNSATVPPQGSAEVMLEYRPGSLGAEETATVTVSSETAGSVEYVCHGQVSCLDCGFLGWR